MAYTPYTPTTDEIRITRTLIPDVEAVFGDNNDETMFSDAEITDFLSAGTGSVLRAAGYATYAIATSEALISKVIKTQDLGTNGAAVANALILKGNALFARADKQDAQAGFDYFEIIDFDDGWANSRPELTEWNWSYYRES